MTPAESLIPIEYLRECLELRAGALYWKPRPESHFKSKIAHLMASRVSNLEAGRVNTKGYRVLMLSHSGKKVTLLCHRVVWALHTGRWPENVIDHINRVKTDNRPSNMRDVEPDVNLRNNGNPKGTGLVGAYRSGKRFISVLQGGGRYQYLGTFDTAEQASAAFVASKRKQDEQDAATAK